MPALWAKLVKEMAVFVDFDYDSMIFYFENFIGRGHITQKTSRNAKLIVCIFLRLWQSN